jgi:hypothetical protein
MPPSPADRSNAKTPPGLGGLLMVIGFACCLLGAALLLSRVQILVSEKSVNLMMKGLPFAVGATLVVIGAAVKRAISRAAAIGARQTTGSQS